MYSQPYDHGAGHQYYSSRSPAPQLTHSTSSSSHHSSHGYRTHTPAQYHQDPPPGADPQLWQWFNAVDTDRSGSISSKELHDALVNGDWSRFDQDTVKMLMNVFDTDHDGAIGFPEFAGLWKYISEWQAIFKRFDRDRSGSIDGAELADALRSFGYGLSPALLRLLEAKYSSAPPSQYEPPPGITFDRFLRACVFVKTLTEAFQKLDTNRDGWIDIDYEEFMKIVLMAP